MANGKIRVRLRAFDAVLIDQSAKAIVQTVQKAGAKVSGPIPLPTRINKVTVLRSPHVNKKSREQFEMRTHKRLIDIMNPSQDVMDSLMKLKRKNRLSVTGSPTIIFVYSFCTVCTMALALWSISTASNALSLTRIFPLAI